MCSRRTLDQLVATTIGLWLTTQPALAQIPEYPETRQEPVIETVHGVTITDPYRWLEDGDDPRVAEWTDRQNAFTRNYLDQFPKLRSELQHELEQAYEPTIPGSPHLFGKRYFFMKRETGQNHAVLYIRVGSLDAPARAVIDPNTFSSDGTQSLDWWHPSRDGSLIVYGRSSGGNEDTTLYLRDTRTGKDTDLIIPHARHSSVAWDPDGSGFHYTRHPAPGTVPPGEEMYHRYVYYHKLGTNWQDDPQIPVKGQCPEMSIGFQSSCDYQYQLLDTTTDWARNDLYVRHAGADAFIPVVEGINARFIGEVYYNRLFVLTNHEAPRYRIVRADIDEPTPEHWKDIVPEQKGVILEFRIVGGKLITHILEDVHSRLFIHNLDGTVIREIELPTLGSVSDLQGSPERDDLFFGFSSFAYPNVQFHVDLATGEQRVTEKLRVKFDADQFVTRQVWYTSKDGTRVPLFVVHKKDLQLDGNNPTLLDAYGGFNISIRPGFRRNLIPWLTRGGVFALANIRGGGEFGKAWHLAGRREKKQNVFDDMIAAAEKLIADGYTRRERLGTSGGSNGGLLMGALMTQRPDLFKAIYCAVPLLDMVRYHLSTIARLWIPEYGTAENAEDFTFLHAYSPYHHVTKNAQYPTILFKSGEFDTRVDPMHARKMTALMQASSASPNPILLWVERKTGHGGGKPVRKRIESSKDYWTFFMWQLGMVKQPG